MIVKNESKVIERLLASVISLIDCYCICDTGSTDNTVEIIESFFNGVSIPGKIINEPFRDFGYNRTFALQECMKMDDVDYILLLDADMVLKKAPKLCVKTLKSSLTADAYYLIQGTDTFQYKNIRIVKKNPALAYCGVTHEFIKLPEEATRIKIDKSVCWIYDIGDGGAKTDKFERDIQLLEKGLIDEPKNERYMFYLANSYRDAGQPENAIDRYKERIKMGGWREEIWHSYFSIGECYEKLGDMPNAISYWLDAYDYSPDRIENMYKIVNYYRKQQKNRLAYTVYNIAKTQIHNKSVWDHLFLKRDVYDYKLDYEFTIFGYYHNPEKVDIANLSCKLLSYPHVEESIRRNILSNYKFYAKSLSQHNTFAVDSQQHKVLASIGDMALKNVDMTKFVSSTPSIVMNKTRPHELIVNVRYVNYRIDDAGRYVNQENVETVNVIAVINTRSINKNYNYNNANNIGQDTMWEKTSEFILEHNRTLDNRYIGIEDVRLFISNGDLFYNGNRGFHDKFMIEHGAISLKTKRAVSALVTIENQQRTEKNWVLFRNNETSILNMIYGWHPLVIGDIDERKAPRMNDENQKTVVLNVMHTIETPAIFKHVRGSTNGVNIGGEIWFIGHVVSYEDRRYYYHMFIVLDSGSYKVKKYTKLFTFEKEKVEYTLGFAYLKDSDEFLIGYSLMDSETKYMMIPKSSVDELMV